MPTIRFRRRAAFALNSRSRVAQLAERRPHKPEAAGSSPAHCNHSRASEKSGAFFISKPRKQMLMARPLPVQAVQRVPAPFNEKSHAGLAKGRATQQFARGTISSGKKAAIDAHANRVIGHTFHSIKGK